MFLKFSGIRMRTVLIYNNVQEFVLPRKSTVVAHRHIRTISGKMPRSFTFIAEIVLPKKEKKQKTKRKKEAV